MCLLHYFEDFYNLFISMLSDTLAVVNSCLLGQGAPDSGADMWKISEGLWV